MFRILGDKYLNISEFFRNFKINGFFYFPRMLMDFLIHQVYPVYHEAIASVLQFLFLHQKKNHLNRVTRYFQYFAVLF